MNTTVQQEVRKILKANFKTKFSVTKRDYNCVNVNWTNGPSTEQVDALIGHFQKGHFDGMTDSYDYSNSRKDIPQVMYLFTNRTVTKDIYEKAFDLTKNFFACFEGLNSLEDTIKNGGGYFHSPREYLAQFISKINLEFELTLNSIKKEVFSEECVEA